MVACIVVHTLTPVVEKNLLKIQRNMTSYLGKNQGEETPAYVNRRPFKSFHLSFQERLIHILAAERSAEFTVDNYVSVLN